MTKDVPSDSSKLPTIALVDHDARLLDIMIDELSGIEFPDNFEPLTKRYRFVRVLLPESDNVDSLAERAMTELRTFQPTGPDIVLVDLSFGRQGPRDPVAVGARLASILQQHLAVPVGVYTRYQLEPAQRVEISMYRFDVVFEHTLTDRPPLLADRWDGFFKRLLQHQDREPDVPYNRPLPADCDHIRVNWEPGHPTTRSLVFQMVAPKLAKLALQKLYSTETSISMSQLSGGFSGSYVLRLTVPDRKRKFILKVDEDPSKLVRELGGLRTLVGSVAEHYYVTTIPTLLPDVVTLWPCWWGALALTYEERAAPLISCSELSPTQLADVYTRLWRDTLVGLYRPIDERKMLPNEVLSEDVFSSAETAIQTLDRYLQSLKARIDDTTLHELNAGIGVLKDSRTIREQAVVSSLWASAVHGDLNCRNILLDPGTLQYRLIDFPNVKPNWLTTDFVKAEAELILLIMDWGSGEDTDLRRVVTWASLTRTFSQDLLPGDVHFPDKELERIATALVAIRSMYIESTNGHDCERAYYLHLFGVISRYTSYPDITVAKRVLALCWLGQLAGSLTRP